MKETIFTIAKEKGERGEQAREIIRLDKMVDKITNQELREVKRVCGENFGESDIPTFIRNRGENKNDRSEQNPLGGTLEPYDIRGDR